jgi:hypothetical protein
MVAVNEGKKGEKLHVGEGQKIGQNASTPLHSLPPPTPALAKGGPVYTTVSQKKRYITISGIQSDISWQEQQWPEFGFREQGANASDFFKIAYPNATANERRISFRLVVDTVTRKPVKLLRIIVRNSNVKNYQVFQDLPGIFDYDNWVSTKRNQHRMTGGGLGDFLKRGLGMGYASWTANYNPDEDSFEEEEQWPEPVTLRFNEKEYKVFLIVNSGNPTVDIQGPFNPSPENNIGTDTEVEVVLPLINYWAGSDSSILLINLEQYYQKYKLFKRNIEFSFVKEVIQ